MSDPWLAFGHEANAGGQEVTLTNGGISGKVTMRQAGTALVGSINGGPEQVLVRDVVPLSGTGRFQFTILMPLNRSRGVTQFLDNDLVPEYAGRWTVDANPKLGEHLPPGTEPEARTPFYFDLLGLHLTVPSAVYREDQVIPQSETEPEKRLCQGATYRVNGAIVGPEDNGYGTHPLAWKAEVISPSNEVIRTIYGIAGSAQSTSFTIDWDGKRLNGQPADGGIKYGVRVKGIARDNVDPDDPAENSGGRLKTTTVAEGPPDADLPPFGKITATPNPYIVYEYRFDEEGYAVWPDDNEDGVPDRFPDDDGDGVPDYEAGTVVPIVISAPLNRKGYDTTWSVEVFAEDGSRLHEPWTGVGDVDIIWDDPPQDLEPQEFTYKVTASTCRSPVALEVLAQQAEGCVASNPSTTQQYGASPGILEIRAGGLKGTSEDKLKNPSEEARARLGKVNPDVVYTLVASELTFTDQSSPETVTALLGARGSLKVGSVPLEKVERGGEIFYEGDVSLDSLQGDEEPTSTYTFIDAYLEDKTDSIGQTTEDFFNHRPSVRDSLGLTVGLISIQLFGPGNSIMPYDGPQMLGFFTPYRPVPETSQVELKADEAYCSTENVLAGPGFLTFQATIQPEQNPGLSGKIQATVKIEKAADMLFTYTHGLTAGDLILDQAKQEYLKADTPGLDLSSIKTWLVAGCHVLDMHDYNNNKVDRGGGRTGPDDPINMRLNTGAEWWRATGNGRTILLGYNYPAQGDGTQKALAAFDASMEEMRQAGVPDTKLQQYAWLDANLKTWNRRTGHNLNACAWDDEFYYFISYDPSHEAKPVPPDNFVKRRIFGAFKIPLDANGENFVVKPTTFDASGPAGAEPIYEISIPQAGAVR